MQLEETMMSYRSTSDGYGQVAVAIHWTSALVIVGALVSGIQAAGLLDPVAKTGLLRVDVSCGGIALALTLARLGWWLADRRPDPVSGMSRLQARLRLAPTLSSMPFCL
jgi:cytochrome b561